MNSAKATPTPVDDQNPLTHGPLLRAILQLSWPMMVGNFLQTAFNIIGLFTQDAATIEVGTASLEIFSIGFIAIPLNLIFGRALQGAGDTVSPLIITAFARLPVLLGLLYLLPRYTRLGMDGLWYGFMLTSFVEGGLKLFWFMRGKWKMQRV